MDGSSFHLHLSSGGLACGGAVLLGPPQSTFPTGRQQWQAHPIGGWLLFLGRFLYIPLTLLALLADAWFGGIG